MQTTVSCRRCGGSGSYSFNLKDGTTCYGCMGSGLQQVDINAEKSRQEKIVAKQEKEEARRAQYRAVMQEVSVELNLTYGPFDLDTALGLDKLNLAVSRATGRTLAQHRDARLS
jgi:hypothetical protein